MVIPLELTFRNMSRSGAIEAAVRERAAKLDRYYPRITSCHVIVEQSHGKPRTAGSVYHVRVDVTVPGSQLVAHQEPPPQRFREDVYIAIRDAFHSVRRKLEEYARKQRGDVKTHEAEPSMEHLTGRVARLFPDHGFIETAGGSSVYFHRNSVGEQAFERLALGSRVRFAEEDGEHGPQASSVVIEE
jgi:ribosomal subunit interface protein